LSDVFFDPPAGDLLVIYDHASDVHGLKIGFIEV